MKKALLVLFAAMLISLVGCASLTDVISGSEGSTEAKKTTTPGPIPAGLSGVYAVSHNGGGEDEKLMFPEDVTGLILERSGESYDIYLANVYEGGEGEKFEKLDYDFVNDRFSIYFGEVLATGEAIVLDLASCSEGLCGFMVVGEEEYELRLAKQ